jgi:hypothetical protein
MMNIIGPAPKEMLEFRFFVVAIQTAARIKRNSIKIKFAIISTGYLSDLLIR